MFSIRQILTDWFPVFMRYTGLIGVCVELYFFIQKGRVDASLLIMFGTMMGLSEITRAVNAPPSIVETPEEVPVKPRRTRKSVQQERK